MYEATSGVGGATGCLRRVPLSAILLAGAISFPASVHADDQPTAKDEPDANSQAERVGPPAGPSASPAGPESFCQALAAAAAANDLPVDFFTQLIWQESRFKPSAVSRKGAQGVAQFMPETARLLGLEDPFNPLEAIAKSARLLRDLQREFGNLGLAAAAYNAGPGRVRDWLGGRRPLPGETRAYVRLVTGRNVEEWAGSHAAEMPVAKGVPCSQLDSISAHPKSDPLRATAVKGWGVEVVGGPTPAKALARYREWQLKYPAILAAREPVIVIRGIIGEMGAARARVGADTQAEGKKLCAELRAAGTYCDVLRN
jgi:transglycosylase-like protein with SLT domain